jgi:hypothetical protein
MNAPKLQNEALQDCANMFLANPPDPTPGSELLDSSRLDFTVNSLALLDQHLEAMRSRNLQDKPLITFVLRSGAYVGEVIRRHAKGRAWHWLDYDEAAKLNKQIAGFQKSLSNVAVLWDSKEEFCFPLSKVLKYLANGSGDSVKFFAEVIIAKPNESR